MINIKQMTEDYLTRIMITFITSSMALIHVVNVNLKLLVYFSLIRL